MEAFMKVILENSDHWYDCNASRYKEDRRPQWAGVMRCMILGAGFLKTALRLFIDHQGFFRNNTWYNSTLYIFVTYFKP